MVECNCAIVINLFYRTMVYSKISVFQANITNNKMSPIFIPNNVSFGFGPFKSRKYKNKNVPSSGNYFVYLDV